MMDKRKLGKSGIEIKPVGAGLAAIGGYYTRGGRVASRGEVDDAESIRAIHAALAHEISLFDVGNIYGAGHAERILGKALADGKRQQAVIQTKFGASFDEVTRRQIDYEERYHPEWIVNSLEGSLRRLRTEYVDIFQFQIADYPPEHLPEIITVLDDLVQQGRIRAYSIGTREIDRARLFAEAPHCAAIITNQNIFMDAPEMLALLETYDVALLAGLPFYMGLLTGKYSSDSVFAEDDVRQRFDLSSARFAGVLSTLDNMRDILQSEGRTIIQGALAWIWTRHPLSIPVPGFKTVAQIEENAAALNFGTLTSGQMAQIAEFIALYEKSI